jgi:N-acetylglucosaminyldiphosphoundecaprenol N-acetyl-beta-D-mannosaminyltransferase
MNRSRKQLVVSASIDATSYDEVCARTKEWVDSAQAARMCGAQPPPGKYVCAASVHGIISARSDAGFRRALNEADVATPDGMPVVWAMRSFGCRRQQRVYGPTLMLRVCARAERDGHRIFLYGGSDDVLGKLTGKLAALFPALQIAGTHAPPFRPLTDEEDALVSRAIRDSGADIVFVGIGAPKQERWMWAHRAALPGVVMFGVGAAFNFHSGCVRQAPRWMQSHGLEWFYRLLMEPRRLWRRYLLQTPLFLPLWFLQLGGWRRATAPHVGER